MTPDEFTNQDFFLDVGSGHRIYVHDWGQAEAAVPIVYLHGGPGDGCDNRDKKKFEPLSQRVIFFDQRGAGKSTPSGLLKNNTTKDLVEDIEKVALRLKLDKFILVGGSWGSTLALCYGIAHPTRVLAIVIDGVFSGTQPEIDWLDQGGWRRFFPDIWQEYIESVPLSYRDNPSAYHMKKAFGADPAEAKKSAYAYTKVELAVLKLDDRYAPQAFDDFDPNPTFIEMHYMINKCFLPESYIAKQAAKLTMPVRIVQGRYDMVCPPATAYRLNEVLPNSQLIWTINGHMRQHEAATVQRLLLEQIIEGA